MPNENQKLITSVDIEHDAIFVSDGKRRTWICGMPGFLNHEEIKEIHTELERVGFKNYDNRMVVINAISEHFAKQTKKDYKFTEAKKFFSNYLELADFFLEKQPVYYDNVKIWWAWNFKTFSWDKIDETDLLNSIHENYDLPDITKDSIKSEIMNALKMKARKKKPILPEKTWVQFKEKIIDVLTGEERPASPHYFIKNPLPWALGETEETPIIDKLFTEWVGEKYLPTLQEIIAFSMLPDYCLNRVFCAIGVGRNGKTTWLNLMTMFLGSKNVCSSDLDYLSTNQFAPSKLYGKLLCLIGEINASVFKKTDTFKKLLGQDIFSVEYKGKDGFDAYNYAKVCIATNKLPETSDKTKGFYSKWVIIDFPNSFKENPYLLKTIPEIEYSNLAKKSCRILKELLARGEFTNEGSAEDKENCYEERATPFKEFLTKECVVGPEYSVALWEICEAYQDYCAERNFRKPSKREISVILENKGFTKELKHYYKETGEETTKWVFNGIGLNSDTIDTKDTHFPTTTSYEKLSQKCISDVSNVSETETELKLASVSEPTPPPNILCTTCSQGKAVFQDGKRWLCQSCWIKERGEDTF